MKRRKKVVSRKKQAKRRGSQEFPIIIRFNRYIIGGIGILLFVFLFSLSSNNLTQSVAGISIAKPLFAQSTVSWERIDGTDHYNLYYKTDSDADFVNAVRNIPSTQTFYTIEYLRKGANYKFRVSAADSSGKEFWFSGTKDVPDPQPM